MKHIIWITASVVVVLSGVALAFTIAQVQEERATLSSDLEYRTRLLSDSLKESIEPSYSVGLTESLKKIVDRFVDQRLSGLAIIGPEGEIVAMSKDLPRLRGDLLFVSHVMEVDLPQGEYMRGSEGTFYMFVNPLHKEERVAGALLVVQNADYIDTNIAGIWLDNLARFAVQILFFSIVLAAIVRWIVIKPLSRLAESVKTARAGTGTHASAIEHSFFLQPIAHEISKMARSLSQARSAASEEARLRLEKLDTPWTAERLKEFVKAYLKNRPIVLVSNREPYVHEKVNGEITCSVPASGMVTALESVMEACGGLWIAHGSGGADREVSDPDGKIRVPPEEPRYTLKRVWLTPKDVQGFYTGFSNEALWPLSHMVHTRPTFRKTDWAAYRRVNGKFAETLLTEIKDLQQPIILVQDYHFALLPRMIKKARPDANVGFFWHIPWPSAEHFSICPWRKELLDGILGADLIGFHTQQHCNNFIETVGKEIESLIDLEHFSISRDGHVSRIEAFPISIAFTNGLSDTSEKAPTIDKSIFKTLGIETEYVGLGVDRLDYTKGILERLKAVELFLDTYPEYKQKFTFLQVASPSREGSQKYREYALECEKEVERVNKKFEIDGWRPVVFEKRHYSHEKLHPLYAAADFCLVTSLHDGMNLVAKEFAAARSQEDGVLILSQFTGAARDLKGALIVNPYSGEETSEAIWKALTMSPAEKHRRMKMMRNAVRDNNVYRWSAEFLKTVANLG